MISKLPPLADVLNLLPDAVCVVNAEGRFLFVSASFERIFGYAPDEVIGRRTFDLVHPDDRAATLQQADQVTAGALQRHFRNRYVHKNGHSVDVQWSAHWLPDYGVRIGVAREVSELRHAELELEHRASHDPLTGLPNRHRLQRQLEEAMEHATQTGDGLALLYLDLDGFKSANDRSGHLAGDRILGEVAHRLQKGLRQGDLIARVGGDEFVVLLPGCSDPAAARIIADSLRARLHPPYALPDGPLRLDASVGIACFPADGSDPDTLLAHADQAMYAAKRERPRRTNVAPTTFRHHGALSSAPCTGWSTPSPARLTARIGSGSRSSATPDGARQSTRAGAQQQVQDHGEHDRSNDAQQAAGRSESDGHEEDRDG